MSSIAPRVEKAVGAFARKTEGLPQKVELAATAATKPDGDALVAKADDVIDELAQELRLRQEQLARPDDEIRTEVVSSQVSAESMEAVLKRVPPGTVVVNPEIPHNELVDALGAHSPIVDTFTVSQTGLSEITHRDAARMAGQTALKQNWPDGNGSEITALRQIGKTGGYDDAATATQDAKRLVAAGEGIEKAVVLRSDGKHLLMSVTGDTWFPDTSRKGKKHNLVIRPSLVGRTLDGESKVTHLIDAKGTQSIHEHRSSLGSGSLIDPEHEIDGKPVFITARDTSMETLKAEGKTTVELIDARMAELQSLRDEAAAEQSRLRELADSVQSQTTKHKDRATSDIYAAAAKAVDDVSAREAAMKAEIAQTKEAATTELRMKTAKTEADIAMLRKQTTTDMQELVAASHKVTSGHRQGLAAASSQLRLAVAELLPVDTVRLADDLDMVASKIGADRKHIHDGANDLVLADQVDEETGEVVQAGWGTWYHSRGSEMIAVSSRVQALAPDLSMKMREQGVELVRRGAILSRLTDATLDDGWGPELDQAVALLRETKGRIAGSGATSDARRANEEVRRIVKDLLAASAPA